MKKEESFLSSKRLITLNLLMVIIITSCNSNFKEYYYTSSKSDKSKIYEYSNKEDTTETQYWKIRFNDGKMTTDAYNSSFVKFESFTEKINTEGTELLEYLNFDEKGDSIFKEIV